MANQMAKAVIGIILVAFTGHAAASTETRGGGDPVALQFISYGAEILAILKMPDAKLPVMPEIAEMEQIIWGTEVIVSSEPSTLDNPLLLGYRSGVLTISEHGWNIPMPYAQKRGFILSAYLMIMKRPAHEERAIGAAFLARMRSNLERSYEVSGPRAAEDIAAVQALVPRALVDGVRYCETLTEMKSRARRSMSRNVRLLTAASLTSVARAMSQSGFTPEYERQCVFEGTESLCGSDIVCGAIVMGMLFEEAARPRAFPDDILEKIVQVYQALPYPGFLELTIQGLTTACRGERNYQARITSGCQRYIEFLKTQ